MLARFPTIQGAIAAHPKAWDLIFDASPAQGANATDIEGDWAKVKIRGPLTQAGSWWCDSYKEILSRCEKAFASGAPGVCLVIDSPGGDFAGCIETARALRKMADASGKALVAYTETIAHSAAYAIACAADEIVGTPSSAMGNVGVWAQLTSVKAADKAYGVAIEIVASGSAKADRNPHVEITDSARERMQSDVDDMAALFFDWVKERRGIDAKAIGGADVLGARALELRLADKIVDGWSEYKGASSQGGGETMAKNDWLSALRAAAESGDEGAKKALKAATDEDKPEPEDKDKEAKAKKKAEADEKEKKDKEAKAAAEEEEDKKDKEEKAKKAAASSAAMSSEEIASTLNALTARNEAADRAALMAARPDFSKEQREFLATCTLAQVKAAVETFPKQAMPNAANGANTVPDTQGKGQGSGDFGGPIDATVAKAMGQGAPTGKFYLGCGDVKAAEDFLKKGPVA